VFPTFIFLFLFPFPSSLFLGFRGFISGGVLVLIVGFLSNLNLVRIINSFHGRGIKNSDWSLGSGK